MNALNPGHAPLFGKRVLVIEDNAQNMRLFRAVLQLAGALVLTADRALPGIEIARRELPDLILMDIQMPDMDGLTATRRIRASEETRHLPIIAVTASVLDVDQYRVREAGCDGYLPKPINPDTFADEVVALLERARHPVACGCGGKDG